MTHSVLPGVTESVVFTKAPEPPKAVAAEALVVGLALPAAPPPPQACTSTDSHVGGTP
jgi:hypothetical protein